MAPERPFDTLAGCSHPIGRPRLVAGNRLVVFIVIALLAPAARALRSAGAELSSDQPYPSAEHWLGTDQFGRDVLSRLIYGSRNSLIFGLISPILAAIVGTALGVMAGYFGGIVDRLVTRIIDLLLAFPELLLAIMIAAALGGGFWNIVAVMTVAFVPGFARVARASTLAVKQEPYVEAVVAVGLSTPMIIFATSCPTSRRRSSS